VQPAVQRLKTRPQFQAVLAGQIIAKTPHFALHRAFSSEAGDAVVHAVGAMVPKRWARRAVTRNAIKRQIYTVSAISLPQMPPAGHVVRLRAAFAREQFRSATSTLLKTAVRLELEQLFARARTP
jgi:ribonuclease P protein component